MFYITYTSKLHAYHQRERHAGEMAIFLIIGVVQDSVETTLNGSGDVFFTATAEEFDRKKKG